jgi:hypothetical protein
VIASLSDTKLIQITNITNFESKILPKHFNLISSAFAWHKHKAKVLCHVASVFTRCNLLELILPAFNLNKSVGLAQACNLITSPRHAAFLAQRLVSNLVEVIVQRSNARRVALFCAVDYAGSDALALV